MSTAETVAGLANFPRRGAGTEAERRAAKWLASELEAGGRGAQLEPFWCRPSWALAQLWHVGFGLIGSLVAVSSPRVGGAMILVALLCVIADAVTGLSPGRRLTPERASQNVTSGAPDSQARVRLLITANYDAGRTGLVYRPGPRQAIARLSSITGRLGPGWLGWLVLALAWLLAIAVLRLTGSQGSAIGVAQLPPTIVLVLALALLVELATSDFGPAANDNASGVAAAIATVRALDAGPPLNVAVELVLAGAGDVGGLGMRIHLRRRRRQLRAPNTVVLGIAPSGAGQPRWWISDGQLVPQRYLARLRGLCEQIAAEESHLGAAAYRGRGATPGLPARAAGLPAISIGCLDADGLARGSHQAADGPENIDQRSLDITVQFALMLVDGIDAYIGQMPSGDAGKRR